MSEKSITMNLYLLSRNDIPVADEWARCLVVAQSEASARELANQGSGSEGYLWTDGTQVEARLLGQALDDIDGGVLIFSRE